MSEQDRQAEYSNKIMKKRRQHFVPQMYQKLFSYEEKKINVWNLKEGKIIVNAPIKRQAYENFFYGKDEKFEDLLATIEGEATTVLKHIVDTENVPFFGDPGFYTLLTFVVLFSGRTLESKESLDDAFDKTAKLVLKKDPKFKDILGSFNLKITNGVEVILQHLAYSVDYTMDLSCKLIKNETSQEFITSDHPVIKQNYFLKKRKHPGTGLGFANTGFLMQIPISPQYYLIFFDKEIYKVGDRKKKSISLNNIKDVNLLNTFQCQNANKILFFSQKVEETYIQSLVKNTPKMQSKRTEEIEMYNANERRMIEVIKISEKERCSNIKPSFIRYTKKASKKELGTEWLQVRKPEYAKRLGELSKAENSDRK